jgi:hypothetical protein
MTANDLIQRNAECARQLLEAGAEIERLRDENQRYATANMQLQAELDRLRAEATRTEDVIAQWANDEVISFNATERLWRALGDTKP